MSLNRYEKMLLDYVQERPDEKRYWMERVLETDKLPLLREQIVLELNNQLWSYFEERSLHESPFIDVMTYEGKGKISMLNLSEYLLAAWTPPKPQKAKKHPDTILVYALSSPL